VKSNGHLPHLPNLLLVEGFIQHSYFPLDTGSKCQVLPQYVPKEILLKVGASKKEKKKLFQSREMNPPSHVSLETWRPLKEWFISKVQ
jgi:hypothetical protein